MPGIASWLATCVVLLPGTVAWSAGPRGGCRAVCPRAVVRLPKDNSEAVRMLDGLSNTELVSLMRDRRVGANRLVFDTVLKRRGIHPETCRAALSGLAEVSGRDVGVELFQVMYSLDRGPNPDDVVSAELGEILLTLERERLEKNWSSLRTLARYGRRSVTRKYGWAAYSTVGAIPRLQTDARGSRELPFLTGVPLVPDEKRRRELKPLVEEILGRATSPQLIGEALAALPACDPSTETVERLLEQAGRELHDFREAEPVLEGEEAAAATVRIRSVVDGVVRGLRNVSPDEFPAEQVSAYVTLLEALVAREPLSVRVTESFRGQLAHASSVVERVGMEGGDSAAETADLDERLTVLDVPRVEVSAVRREQRFDRERIEVVAGRPIEIRLVNGDDLPQNLVVTRPGAVESVGMAADDLRGDRARERAFVPETNDVLFASPLVPPLGSASLVFVAPSEPGDYHFLSTVAEQWRTMQGTLRVVEPPAE